MGDNSEQQKQSILEKIKELFIPRKVYKAKIEFLERMLKVEEDINKGNNLIVRIKDENYEKLKNTYANQRDELIKLKKENSILSRENKELKQDNQKLKLESEVEVKEKLESVFQILEKNIEVKIKDIEDGYLEQMTLLDEDDSYLEQMAMLDENEEFEFFTDAEGISLTRNQLISEFKSSIEKEKKAELFDYLKDKLNETLSNLPEDVEKQFTQAWEETNKTPEKVVGKVVEHNMDMDFEI